MRRTIFHERWWLDAIAPGHWRQVEFAQGDRASGSLPFVEVLQAGLKACAMPQATRVLGPAIAVDSRKTETGTRMTRTVVNGLLRQLDAHDHVEMVLDTEFVDLTPFVHAGYEVKLDPTLLLDCTRPMDALWAGLRDKTRNAIRRAKEQLVVAEIQDIDRFARFYNENLGGEEAYFDIAVSCAAISAACARKQARILAATDARGAVHAMAVFLWDDVQVYFFHSSRRSASAHVGSVSLLLWTGIELAHSLGLRFDFDGGLLKQSRYKFLVSFGGQIANRYEVSRSNRIYRLQRFVRKIPRAAARRVGGLDLVRRIEKLKLYCTALGCLALL